MIYINASIRWLIFSVVLLSAAGTTHALPDQILNQSTQRTGTIDYINVGERRVVINDQIYQLSSSARLTSAVASGVGKQVRFTVVGEGAGRVGSVVQIRPARRQAR